MVFSDTTNRTGIVQLLEDLTSTQSASTSSYPLAVKTRDINNAFADYKMISSAASSSWQDDDTNHSDYAEIYGSIVSGQQDYTFTEDENGNQILDIYRVECKDAAGNWQLLQPYNENLEITALEAQATSRGTPFRYYKTANGIFLDKTPNYNSTNGLKIYYNRTPSYFLSTDTTKEPGIPQMFHRYLAYKPAFWYWLPKDSNKASIYKSEVDKMEISITEYFNKRAKDERPRIAPKYYDYN
jgi:hypothetical protein